MARACVIGARKDIMARFKFVVELAMTRCAKGSFTTARGASSVWKFYLPPNSSVHYNKEVIELLAGCDENSTIGGDMN